MVYSQEELNEMVRLAGENRMQVAMHAIGDHAVEQAITALEQKEARTDNVSSQNYSCSDLRRGLTLSFRKVKADH